VKQYLKLLAVSLCIAIGILGVWKEQVSAQEEKGIIGSRATDFALKSVSGKTVHLSDFKHKIIIIDFWATWCGPCRRGIPDLIALQKEFRKDLVIIGISLDDERTKSDVPAFVKNYKISYPVLYADDKIADAYGGIEGIPTAFVIDRKGKIREKHVGLVDRTRYSAAIRSLLQK
jgi:thiol-disulfide isomerase/thioredoxin